MEAKETIAHIEANISGRFYVYVPDDLPFGLTGEGKTPEEAKQDFLNVYEAVREDHKEETQEDVVLNFRFVYDTTALLHLYKNIITLSGLAKLSGVNKSQLSQYVCGVRYATPKTEEKIKEGLRKLAKELLEVLD